VAGVERHGASDATSRRRRVVSGGSIEGTSAGDSGKGSTVAALAGDDVSEPADERRWHRVAAVAELREGEAFAARAGETPIALFKVDGAIYATHDICTHEYAYLSEGYLDGCVVECPLHQGRFDIRTGKALCAPLEHDLPVYPVRIVGADVLVGTGGEP
jgi:nitrite reductase/ring-hydroxylating ferredoxin subunit